MVSGRSFYQIALAIAHVQMSCDYPNRCTEEGEDVELQVTMSDRLLALGEPTFLGCAYNRITEHLTPETSSYLVDGKGRSVIPAKWGGPKEMCPREAAFLCCVLLGFSLHWLISVTVLIDFKIRFKKLWICLTSP